MKKKIIYLITLFLSTLTFAQYSVSKSDAGRLVEFEKERLERFKGTTTVFILSNVYSKSEYEAILKESWTVTPFIVVSANDFDYMDYLDVKYSFAHLQMNIRQMRMSFSMECEINFYNLDIEKLNSKIEKVKKSKHKQEALIDLIRDTKRGLATIGLFCNTEVVKLADKNNGSGGGFSVTFRDPSIYTYSKKTNDEKVSDYQKSMIELVYDKPSFKNYSLGHLKNYFQIINKHLDKEEFIWMFDIGKKPEVIKDLKTATLYLPEYIKVEYNPRKIADSDFSEKDLKEILEAYKYKYEFISPSDLDAKILNNEEFYYLRFGGINAGSFFQIVNGKSGEVVFQNYAPLRYNIKDKSFKELNTAIDSK